MFGVFLLLPVLSPYVKSFKDSTPLLIGLSVGIQGFAQALMQIPMGFFSDKFGRKRVFTFGMLLFIVGSVLGGIVNSAKGMVLARFLQGLGAVSSVVLSLSADLIREEVRTRAFAVIGATIGLSFALSMVLANPLAHLFGVSFIFFLLAFLSALSTLYILLFIREVKVKGEVSFSLSPLKDKNLLLLDFSMMLLHSFLAGLFTVMPLKLLYDFNLPKAEHWKVYLPSVLLSLLLMGPVVFLAEKRKKTKLVFLLGIALMGLGFFLFFLKPTKVMAFLCVLLFFLGFNFLEPIIPSLLTKFAPEERRGTASGIFNTFQFLGTFLGGLLGGIFLKFNDLYLFLLFSLISPLWILLVAKLLPEL